MATHWKEGLGLAALSLALTLTACGGDSEAKPPKKDGGSFIPDDEEEDAGEDAEVVDESDAGTDAGIEEDPLQASAAEAQTKGWVEACYKQPKINKELLNSCAKAWRKFDKTLYPASWKEGEALPALP